MAVYTLLLGIRIFSSAFRPVNFKKKFKRMDGFAAAFSIRLAAADGALLPLADNQRKDSRYVVGSVSLTEFLLHSPVPLLFYHDRRAELAGDPCPGNRWGGGRADCSPTAGKLPETHLYSWAPSLCSGASDLYNRNRAVLFKNYNSINLVG
jgi:hypothetical protein